MHDELLSRGIRARYTELTQMMMADPSITTLAPRRAMHVGMRMPRHVRPQPGKVRAYQPLPRY